ncbi:protein kinase [Nocardiopsis sp. NPDC007018]|uniref:protein kinase domain-containing protein n=1 Tax=Nocardiopsis sp. NPDC007018 TaxID=3155721 RepID=UPI0033ED2F01
MSGEERHDRLAPGFHSPEVLYRGAASTVYRARRDGDGAPVALKVMRDDAGAGEVDRLVELSGVAGLVRAVGGGRTSSGRAFVAMDLHPEGDYASAMADRGPLPVAEVLAVGRAVAEALAALHERGLLHHRVEPANVLRAPGGAVLADVGGVLPVEGRAEPVGLDPVAVAYASPEALGGRHPLTPASDTYRLGAVLWALLAGHPPFARGPGEVGDPFAYRERALSEGPPRLPRADLPGRLRALLDRVLSRDPDRRPSAAELARDLAGEGAGAGEGAPSEPGGPAGAPAGAGPEPETTDTAANPWGVPGAVAVPGGAGQRAAAGDAGREPDAPASPAHSERAPEPSAAEGPPPVPSAPANPWGVPGAVAGPGDATGATVPGAVTTPAARETTPTPPGDVQGDSGGPSGPEHAAQAASHSSEGDHGPGSRPSGDAGPAPASAASLLADHPEIAWAALPGWAGTSAPAARAVDDPPAPPEGAGTERTPHREPTPPTPPEPPRLQEVGARPQGPAARRPLFIGVTVVAIALVAVALGAVAILRPSAGGDLLRQLRPDAVASPEAARTPGDTAEPSGTGGEASGDTAPPAGLVEDAAPGGVTLDDAGHTVTVSWTDNSDPAAAHQVVGGVVGETPGNLADAEPGSGQARVSGLDPGREYCFIVIAVLSVDEIAPSEQVCTERTSAS